MTEKELKVLRCGLLEWSGSARGTEEFAVAMGFSSLAELLRESKRIRSALAQGEGLEPVDWARVLLATEVAFVSDVVGSGHDWSITTGFSDEEAVKILRSVQRKLARTVLPLIGHYLGTRAQE
ncbi:hypothetical protein RKE29_00195 [Streptomyces sp. B1866]|uniref:hypothetical protein n=1 Tax=Streptomyces sp. B1866 TaxID=3075431 RepID=UPI002891A2BD|nr:hypothetical protein [Streptomyces sp. B1866]MDT3395093.1 hypothetical protein [Streptomyces sp. B1866]